MTIHPSTLCERHINMLMWRTSTNARSIVSKNEMTHKKLLAVVLKLPDDYVPWGEVVRWEHLDEAYPDCSFGCAYAAWLGGTLSADWCVCTNPASHRVGLLTFEHQGCKRL